MLERNELLLYGWFQYKNHSPSGVWKIVPADYGSAILNLMTERVRGYTYYITDQFPGWTPIIITKGELP